MKKTIFFLVTALGLSCQSTDNQCIDNKLIKDDAILHSGKKSLINPNGRSIESRFLTPKNFERKNSEVNSFATYLRELPLKPDGAKVHFYNGTIKPSERVYDAVVDLKIGKRDLHQCADAIMRLRAEYLWEQNRHDDIHFNFTNGWQVDYSKWKAGHRVKVEGNKTSWVKKSAPSDSYDTFWKYLEIIFSYAGTLSLSKEMKSIDISEIQIGDIFIQGGSPGHAVIVVDLAENTKGDKVFLLAQSYMPAQETQILKNPNDDKMSPWYSTDFGEVLETPEWTFSKDDLKRFK